MHKIVTQKKIKAKRTHIKKLKKKLKASKSAKHRQHLKSKLKKAQKSIKHLKTKLKNKQTSKMKEINRIRRLIEQKKRLKKLRLLRKKQKMKHRFNSLKNLKVTKSKHRKTHMHKSKVKLSGFRHREAHQTKHPAVKTFTNTKTHYNTKVVTTTKTIQGKPEIVKTYQYVPKTTHEIVEHTVYHPVHKYYDENGKEITDQKVIEQYRKQGLIEEHPGNEKAQKEISSHNH